MTKHLLPLLLLLLAANGFAGDLETYYLPADPLRGASLFTEKNCDRCHSIEGFGGTYGPDLGRSDLNCSLLDILALMWNHSPQMATMMSDLDVPRSSFTGKELAELGAYLFYIAYFDKPGDIAEGKLVFSRRGCDKCHRVGGIGRQVGPDLSPIKKYVSPIFLAQEMWNHGPTIKARMDALNLHWPEFEGAEISDLMAFLRDASHDTTSVRIFMRPGNPATGKKLFDEKKCTTCHRVLGMGNAIGPNLVESGFHSSVTSIAAIMWNHGPAIWSKMRMIGVRRPTFDDNEMADLIAFLYFLRIFDSPPDLARGELLFNQKGCPSCHHFGEASVDGSHSLTFSDKPVNSFDLASRMWNHAGEMARRRIRRRIEWPRINKAEMQDLLGYIASRQEE